MTRWITAAGAVLAVAVLAVAAYWYWAPGPVATDPPVSMPAPPPVEPETPVAVPAADEPEPSTVEMPTVAESGDEPPVAGQRIELPPLADSDAFVRQQAGENVAGLLATWLAEEDLVLRAAALLDHGRRGALPRPPIAFIDPPRPFAVRRNGERLVMDAAAYARYDDLVDAALSLPPAQAAALIDLFEPLILEALGELGVEETAARPLLHAVFDEILAAPLLAEPAELVRPRVFYEFADPALEGRSALQKQLLRMGPDSVGRIQAYVRALRRELELRRP